jgi:hypothetical protein
LMISILSFNFTSPAVMAAPVPRPKNSISRIAAGAKKEAGC